MFEHECTNHVVSIRVLLNQFVLSSEELLQRSMEHFRLHYGLGEHSGRVDGGIRSKSETLSDCI